MAVYDKAHELATEIKQSKEYIEYKNLKEKVFANNELKSKIEEFEKIRYEAQLLSIQEGKENPEKVAKLQELYQILVENKDVKNFFDKKEKINVILEDISKIIEQAVKDV